MVRVGTEVGGSFLFGLNRDVPPGLGLDSFCCKKGKRCIEHDRCIYMGFV